MGYLHYELFQRVHAPCALADVDLIPVPDGARPNTHAIPEAAPRDGAHRRQGTTAMDAAAFSFKIFHELMGKKIREILLVSSLYDACIIEEDGRLSERIIHEYRGLNLSRPPRVTWVSSAEEALSRLDQKAFDMVITMPRLADMDAFDLGRRIKSRHAKLPVLLLTHDALTPESLSTQVYPQGIDGIFVWSGNADIILALIKNVEDHANAKADTHKAGVRVILFVEDSPRFASVILPNLYRAVVMQAQAVMAEGLNEEHRMLTMRARPKILHARSYEEATALYAQFEPYILGVISDVSYPRRHQMDPYAGLTFLAKIKCERFDIPLLMTSSEPTNRKKAHAIPAAFIDKNSASLLAEVRNFFSQELGFGDFVFRMPDGREIDRVSNFRALEKTLPTIPEESFYYHWRRNDFSRWLFARSEIVLASQMRSLTDDDFAGHVPHMQAHLVADIRKRRRKKQSGVVVNFDATYFDPETDIVKIGKGSLGGKGRGLVFIATLLHRHREIHTRFDPVKLTVPKTLILTTEGFDTFVQENALQDLAQTDLPDQEVARRFTQAKFSQEMTDQLRTYISKVQTPLSVRSSGLLDDAQFRACAGLYRTYLIANDQPDVEGRLAHLLQAIKLVYASTYYQRPKAFARQLGHRTEDEKMAVILQQLVGRHYGDYFYPDISGEAQSYNYYPFAKMKPEDGIATIVLGLGTMATAQGALRFCPRYPALLPQRSSVEEILANSQRVFHALPRGGRRLRPDTTEVVTLEQRPLDTAAQEPPLKRLTSTYMPDEHTIRDSAVPGGHPVVTFAQVLKHDQFPLAAVLSDIMHILHEGMGCPVEFEFAINLAHDQGDAPEFAILQARPLTARNELKQVDITEVDISQAFCYSTDALGNTENGDLSDIVWVKPDVFDPGQTRDIAQQIASVNARMMKAGRKYILIGPGRWGSADRWLGIPVSWADICGVGAIIETQSDRLKADPSHGSHFFDHITSLGIPYITVPVGTSDFLDLQWLNSRPLHAETTFVAHIKLEKPLTIKVDGRSSRGVIIATDTDERGP
jgi:CheY-like chemotaxis protein